jgi:predicted O-methyltransferase YrrM
MRLGRRTYSALRHVWRPWLRAARRRGSQARIQRTAPLRPEDRSDKRRRPHVLVDLVNEHLSGDGLLVVEVGTRTGRTTRHLARYCPRVARLVAVDRTPPPPGVFDGLDRVEFLQGWSDESAARFENASVDLVFIDADHSAQWVERDLRAWLPKVRPGGIVSGHDYGSKRHPDVKPVVDRFFRDHPHPVRVDANKVWWTFR